MPELPEVESLRLKLAPQILGSQIQNLILRRKDLRYDIPKSLPKEIATSRVVTLKRRSKYLLVNTDMGKTWIIHLGMSGRFFFADPKLAFDKHDHVIVNWQDGRQMRFRDPRRFGMMDWTQTQDLDQHPWLNKLGFEPLTAEFNAESLFKLCLKSTSSIKILIMNAKFVVGIGNIYASEALFLAKINPERQAKSLTQKETKNLCAAIKKVLQNSIDQGGSSIRDYVDSASSPGLYQLQLAVYGRDGQNCSGCGSTILRLIQSGRSSFYCPTCQK